MRFGLIGEHVERSHSKRLHERMAGYEYELISIPQSEVTAFLERGEFQGLNVTMPYKLTVIPYCAELSPAAQKIGSVNTLVRRADGTLYGDNTDCAGFLYLARRTGVDFRGMKVVICGSGGTSRTAAHAARTSGARETVVVSRSGPETYEGLHERHADADIVVNTTPLGSQLSNRMHEKPIELKRFKHLKGVLDVVYDPLRTMLMLDAAEMGVPCGGGLLMLAAQAKFAAEQFAGRPIPDEVIDEAEHELRRDVANIVLIGMSGTGKSSIGRACAERLGRKLVDTDVEIERRVGCSIPEYFAVHGEAAFREVESAVVAELAPQKGIVIATGGGASVRPENARALRANGVVVRVRRPIDQLATDGRPMLDTTTAEELARVREPYYAAAADATIDNVGTIDSAADEAIDVWRSMIFMRP